MKFFALAAPLFLSLLSTTLAGQDAWHMDVLGTLVREQLDPIVSPNQQSSHMHRVVGGSAFAASYDYNTQMKSSCTSAGLTVDKSNYWMPQMYWVNSSTSFYPLPSVNRFYYFLQRDDPNVPVSPFPKGLRMLAGSPNAKAASGWNTYQCQRSITDQYYGPDFNFDSPCAQGIKTEVRFPSCWDGINLYKADGSHMAWPSIAPTFGNCPISHPVRVPSILLEYTWQLPEFAKTTNTRGKLAWANGDTTGYGLHADFQNGWDYDILKAALSDPACVGLGNSIPIVNCPTFAPYVNSAAAWRCTNPDRGSLKEPTGVADSVSIPALPGCNKLWGATGSKPTCSPAVTPLSVSALTGTDGPLLASAYGQESSFKLPTNTTGWSRAGCFFVNSNPTLENINLFYDPLMTPQRCTDACAKTGKSFAAMQKREDPWVCMCGSGLSKLAASEPTQCTLPCPGDSKQTCGGVYFWEVYYGPETKVQQGGCYTPPVNTALPSFVSSATYSFVSSSMTRAVCTNACSERGADWGAVRNGNTCFCGDGYPTGSGFFTPDDQCAVKCSGSTQTCGSVSGLYVMLVNSTGNSTIPSGSQADGRLGCYLDSTTSRALQGRSYKESSLMTPDFCREGCLEMGYSLAGVEGGDTCYCSNNNVAKQIMPNSQCAVPCAGNSSLTCGGSLNIQIYNTSVNAAQLQAVKSVRASNWLGCWDDSPVGTALKNYSYSSGDMTGDSCKEACAGFGYAYAGTQNGRTCRCGSVKPSTIPRHSASCLSPCAGNSTEFCGGGYVIDLYDTSDVVLSTNGEAHGWEGCYNDFSTARTLKAYSYSSTTMTNNECRGSCAQLGYKYGGTTSGNFCYCDNTIATSASLQPSSVCSTPCAGNSTQNCGGSFRINIYDVHDFVIPPQPAGTVGCFMTTSTTTNQAGLSAYSYSAGTMSTLLCRQTCAAQGYSTAGLSFGNKCSCGNAWAGGKRIAPVICNTKCTGNSTEMCGNGFASNVLTSDGALVLPAANGTSVGLQGCFSDPATMRAYTFTSSLMSPALCAQQCRVMKYPVSGVQNGNTCLCGSTMPKAYVPASGCSAPCAGASDQLCGSVNYVAAYLVDPIIKQLTESGNLLGSKPGNRGYIGCYQEASNNGKLLSDYSYYTSGLTTQSCLQLCTAQNYAFAGTTNGKTCYCGNTKTPGTAGYVKLDSECSTPCAGNTTEMCGGGYRVSMYDVKAANVPTTIANQPGLVGCYTPGTLQTSPPYSLYSATMTASTCRSICSQRGYSNAGLAGQYCYCTTASTWGSIRPLSECTVGCPGDKTQLCGGSSLLSIYNTSVTGTIAKSTANTTAASLAQSSTAVSASRVSSSASITTSAATSTRAGTSIITSRVSTLAVSSTASTLRASSVVTTLLSTSKASTLVASSSRTTSSSSSVTSTGARTSVTVSATRSTATASAATTRATSSLAVQNAMACPEGAVKTESQVVFVYHTVTATVTVTQGVETALPSSNARRFAKVGRVRQQFGHVRRPRQE